MFPGNGNDAWLARSSPGLALSALQRWIMIDQLLVFSRSSTQYNSSTALTHVAVTTAGSWSRLVHCSLSFCLPGWVGGFHGYPHLHFSVKVITFVDRVSESVVWKIAGRCSFPSTKCLFIYCSNVVTRYLIDKIMQSNQTNYANCITNVILNSKILLTSFGEPFIICEVADRKWLGMNCNAVFTFRLRFG